MKRAKIISQPNHSATDSRFVESVRAIAHPLDGSVHDYDLLMDLLGNARLVLLGAAMGAGPIRLGSRNARGRTDERTRGEASEKPPLTYPFEV